MQMSESQPKKPRRRPADPSDQPMTFLPQGNPSARRAYLCAIIGILPGLGLLLGPFALFFGFFGYRFAKRDTESRGIGHALLSMILGVLETVFNALGVYFLGRYLEWF
jgi:hypothetical protein